MSDDERFKDLKKYRDTFNQLEKASLSGKWLTEHARLRISVWNSVTPAAIIFFCYRMLESNGSVSDHQIQITPTTDRAVTESDIRTGVGYLLNCFFTTETLTVRRGAIYARAVMRNDKDNNTIDYLCQGYVSSQSSPMWPDGNSEPSVGGQGLINTVIGTDPAAGVEISQTVPTNARWHVRGIQFTLVTAVAVATRRVVVVIDDGANEIFRFDSQSTQLASLTRNYKIADYKLQPADNGTFIYIAAPFDFELLQGYRIRTITENLQAADDYGAPVLAIEEWIEE